MKKSIFDFYDFRSYLMAAIPTKGAERGARTKLAKLLNVQKGLISSIFHGSAQLSLEQAFRVSHFLSHSERERDYFLLLVQKSRAGSAELEKYFAAKIQEVASQRREIHERIKTSDVLTKKNQLLYYSSWHFTAVHMCLRIENIQTTHGISRYLGVPISRIQEILEFFVEVGIAQEQGGSFSCGSTRIHIGVDSAFVPKHHSNWRMQAIHSLDRKNAEDLHYSSVMSISKEAAQKIRNIFLQSIQSTEPVVKDSRDEEVFCLNLDLFCLQNQV